MSPRFGTMGSKKYELEAERYLELKYKARQYPQWLNQLESYRNTARAIQYSDMPSAPSVNSDITGQNAIRCLEVSKKVDTLENAVRIATDAYPDMYEYILISITQGISIDTMEAKMGLLPVGRNKFFELRRRAFWIMDKNFD